MSKAARHLRQFEEAGIFRDYAGRIDKKVLGFGGTTFVSVHLDKQIGEELPYSTAVVVEKFEIEGTMRRIAATIYVDKASHKAIVIGEKGATLKRIGTEARHAMEALFGSKVFLETHVKVKSGWSASEAALRQPGYR